MNQFALSHRTCVSHSTLGQEHCVNEPAMPPVMNLLETLHSHLPEVHELLGTPLLPGKSIFFNCKAWGGGMLCICTGERKYSFKIQIPSHCAKTRILKTCQCNHLMQ